MRAKLLYDADCGFCTRVSAHVPKLRVRAEVLPMQAADLPALGVDPERAEVEMPFVDAAGVVSYGHLAWAAALRTGPLPCRIVGRLLGSRPVAPLARRAYAWISRNRQRLPGGTPACTLPPPDPQP